MKYFGGCDVGSTYTKAVILDETGKIVADTTIRSKINSEQSAVAAMAEVCEKAGLKDSKELSYLIGTGYGRNKVPFADENISEISCHAMGVHVTDPSVKLLKVLCTTVGILFVVYFWNLDQKLLGWAYKQVNTIFDRKSVDIKF